MNVQRMDADATVTKIFTWIAQVGTHDVRAVTDGLNQVTEGDETNNEKVLTYATLAPDLIVQDITWSPADPSEGDTVTFGPYKLSGQEGGHVVGVDAVISGPPICGGPDFEYMQADLDKNCYVDFYDLAQLLSEWPTGNDP